MRKIRTRILAVIMAVVCVTAMGDREADAKVANKVILKSVSTVSANTISVNWKKVYGAKRYEVYCSSEGEGFQKIKSTRSTNYIHKKLDLGTQYKYKVRAILPKGRKTAFSSIKSVKTKDSAYLLNIAKPYNNEGCDIGAFEVVGERYGHGMYFSTGFWSSNEYDVGSVYFNLSGKCSKMTFVCGMTITDSDYDDYEPEVKIYADGNEISNSIWPKWNTPVQKYTVELNQCRLLKIEIPNKVGLGDIVVYK